MKLKRTYQSFPCPYEDCGADKNKVIWWSWPQGRLMCKECGRTFNLKTGTAMEHLQEGRENFLETVAHFATGGTKAWKIAEFLHTCPSRVFYAINKLASICEKLTAELCRGKVNASVLQFDEIKTFCKKKADELWIWTGVEAVSKFWPGLQVGGHDGKVGKALMKEVKQSLANLPLA
ncbi:IS1 family transposase, partial [Candidatus Parvarchaeota archaeon]|nr:IS1 family transposase [Candidatus Parvarchaeota archaeon]